MQQITIGQVGIALTFIVGFISSVGYIKDHFKDWVYKGVEDDLNSITNLIANLETKINEIDMHTCKNYLVRTLKDISNNVELSDVELQRFWEEYDRYVAHDGNSYIKSKVKQLQDAGKI